MKHQRLLQMFTILGIVMVMVLFISQQIITAMVLGGALVVGQHLWRKIIDKKKE